MNMTNWDKILAGGVVRKTVVLHPIWNQYVRITQALILESGMDASYSLALNYMLLTGFFSVVHQGIDEETMEIMSAFLEDEKTIEDLNFEDLKLRYEEALSKKTFKDKM